MDDRPPELIQGRFQPRVGGVFAWLAERMLRKSFASVRLEQGSRAQLAALDAHPGGVMLLMNHPSWWDPLVLTFFRRRFFPTRPTMAPMDAHELRRFRIFMRVGVFGIDPQDPRSARLLISECARRWQLEPRSLLFITPQGRFTDPREPIELKPGAALVAAANPGVAIGTVAVEYPFWSGRKPEVLLRVRRLMTPPVPNARGWNECMREGMIENGRSLAEAAIARSERCFERLIDGERASGPYALWLRAIGRGAEIDAERLQQRMGTAVHHEAEVAASAVREKRVQAGGRP